jgi:predicted DNA-binding ribbon-helix-helix protein
MFFPQLEVNCLLRMSGGANDVWEGRMKKRANEAVASSPIGPAAAQSHMLDALTWEALSDIAGREGITATELLGKIAAASKPNRLRSAARIFIVDYYRSQVAEALECCDSN